MKRFLGIWLVALATVLGGGAVAAKTLVFCSQASPNGFDPALHTDPATLNASSRQIYDRLVEYAPGSGDIVPGLAERWTISEDGLSVTFSLRRQVSFHSTPYFAPSRFLTADDVVFSFRRQMSERHPWHAYREGETWEYFNSLALATLIDDVVKIDDQTVRFVLRRPHAPLFATLAMDFASILSSEYAEQLAQAGAKYQLDRRPVGTGPFVFADYEESEVIRYKANAVYWKAPPVITELVFSITPDAADRLRKLQSGECSLMLEPDPKHIPVFKEDGQIKLLEKSRPDISYLAFRTTIAPFDNSLVRKAFNFAINKQAIVDRVFQGRGEVAKSVLPPGSEARDENLNDAFYDPGLAIQLLEAAGVEDLSMTLLVMPSGRTYNPDPGLMARMIQADLQRIGIEVKLVTPASFGEFLVRARSSVRDAGILYGTTSRMADPGQFLSDQLGCDAADGFNLARWCLEAFDDLLQQAEQAYDQDDRDGLYRQAQALFKDAAPWVAIAHSREFVPMSQSVTGFVPDLFGGLRFNGADIVE
ncbi:peptide ABC transporter substrate-binding protein [Roseibium aquae]|uniref:Peptide ABC transporter substrate-binding protein n=1 Tax=Roseibium aquae TaxID=1323746 RepID=A0A916WVF6_9HYPH|nr:ABC transporter substrate-binding protein [Roseibium aquae]GGB33190.1 peptide ABC transporter substrate-binding protein [Roseibium aquae]